MCLQEKPTERMRLLQILWSKLKKLDAQFTIVHYNALLKVFVENEHEFSTENFMSNIQESGLKPNELAYF